ncbi:hydantoinase [Paecilomyces variotii No. 5]|uniref:Hydantoinase n=1 Tax=Byssochlamys spectabilis (strain No. 5 / NBRC 109023) TaxID=1356009 RepID=V5G908_BYSSN|nr:hydantoinase [Paecilomyces variotii No. 5]
MAEFGRLIIGVDVGGTNTDAVLLNCAASGADAVVASHKAATGADVTVGIESAICALLGKAQVPPSRVSSLMIGTTHFINAVVERDASRLEKVAVIRLAASNISAYTPTFIDFPPALTSIINGHTGIISGGLQVDGSLIGEIKPDEVEEQARLLKEKGLKNVVLVGIYSPIDETYKQEEQVRDILAEELGPGANIILSKEVAGVGLLARENAAILNASIFNFAGRTIRAFKSAMRRLELQCPLYLTSNDGQLLSSGEAVQYPVRIFSSGATNSIRGAAYLSHSNLGKSSKYVIDIGGTTTDIGCLLPSGFPRLASAFTDIGGVRVNFAMPQVESIGLGGGSILHAADDKKVTVGPGSVGHEIINRSLAFGGDTITATDIVAAAGTEIGTRPVYLEPGLVTAAKDRIKMMLESHIDRMKTSPEPCDVLLVGGGSILCPQELEGVSSILVPPHAEVANAVGAAIAEIGAEVEAVVDETDKDAELIAARHKAISKAVSRGAIETAIRIIEEEVTGIAYIDGKCRIVVKVVGPIDYSKFGSDAQEEGAEEIKQSDTKAHEEAKDHKLDDGVVDEKEINIETYKPFVDENRVWHLGETDLGFIAAGCYILGTGGGGSPYTGYLQTRQLLRMGETITIVDAADFRDEALLVPLGGLGSPAVGVERPGGDMVLHACQQLEKYMGIKYGGLLAVEIGGGNGMEPLMWGSSKYYNIPCVDGDLMGRAYPTFEKVTPFIKAKHINELLPASLSSGDGINMILTESKDTPSVDRVLRAACVDMGYAAGSANRPLTAKQMCEMGILKSHSLAWRLGRAVALARQKGVISTVADNIIEVCGEKSAGKLFEGKIVGVGQRLYKGHSYGEVVVEKLRDYEWDGISRNVAGVDEQESLPERVRIPFKNENLIVEAEYASAEKKTLAMVPDLIIILDALTGEAVGVPEYRYGLKVLVLVIAANPLWTSTPRALEIGGPKAFGYDMDYVPFGTYTEPRSVIDEYAPSK